MKNVLKMILIIFTIFGSFCFLANYRAADTQVTSNESSNLEDFDFPISNEGKITCHDILGNKNDPNSLGHVLSSAYSIMRVAAVIIVIVTSMIDFMNATASSDADMLNKALKKFTTKAIVLVAFFLLPTMLDILFRVVFGPGYMCEI